MTLLQILSPTHWGRIVWLAMAISTLPLIATAQSEPKKPDPVVPPDATAPFVNSALDDKIMFYVLLAEASAFKGDFGGASRDYFQIARETKHEELFEKAVQYGFKHGSGDHLLTISRSWIQTHPRSALARVVGLSILVQLNQKTNALTALGNALKATDASARRSILKELPLVFGPLAQEAETVNGIQKVLSPYLTNAETALEATVVLAHLQLEAKNLVTAHQLFGKAVVINPDHPAVVALALRLLKHGETQPKPWLIQRFTQAPQIDGILAFAQWQQEAEGTQATLQTLEKFWQERRDSAALGLLFGRYQMMVSRWRAAQETLQRALALENQAGRGTVGNAEPSELAQEIGLRLAELALKQTPPGDIQAWVDAVSSPRLVRDLLKVQLTQLVQNREIDSAFQILQAFPVSSDWTHQEKSEFWESILVSQGQYGPALLSLEQRLGQSTTETATLLSRASIVERSGDIPKAIALFKELNQRFPNDPTVQNALGFTLAEHNLELNQAQALIASANQAMPNDSMIMDSMGWVAYRLGNLAEATLWLERAYARDPDPEIAAHLGEVYWVQNRRTDAVRVWQPAYDPLSPHKVLVQTLKRLRVELVPAGVGLPASPQS